MEMWHQKQGHDSMALSDWQYQKLCCALPQRAIVGMHNTKLNANAPVFTPRIANITTPNNAEHIDGGAGWMMMMNVKNTAVPTMLYNTDLGGNGIPPFGCFAIDENRAPINSDFVQNVMNAQATINNFNDYLKLHGIDQWSVPIALVGRRYVKVEVPPPCYKKKQTSHHEHHDKVPSTRNEQKKEVQRVEQYKEMATPRQQVIPSPFKQETEVKMDLMSILSKHLSEIHKYPCSLVAGPTMPPNYFPAYASAYDKQMPAFGCGRGEGWTEQQQQQQASWSVYSEDGQPKAYNF